MVSCPLNMNAAENSAFETSSAGPVPLCTLPNCKHRVSTVFPPVSRPFRHIVTRLASYHRYILEKHS